MSNLKKLVAVLGTNVGRVFTGLGAMIGFFGGLQDLTGIGPIAGEKWLTVGIMMFLVGGAIVIIATDMKVRQQDALLGNEHARRLLADGIPAFRENYMQYVHAGNFEIISRFWSAGFFNITDTRGRRDLHVACEQGHSAVVRGILERGADAKQFDASNRTPLMLAMRTGKPQTIDALLDHDCALNATSQDDGCTALHYAAAHGHLEAAKTLIRNGANVNVCDQNLLTPLIYALVRQRWDVASHLLTLDELQPTRVDSGGATAANYAVEFGAPEPIMEALAKRKVRRSPGIKMAGNSFSAHGRVGVTWANENAWADGG